MAGTFSLSEPTIDPPKRLASCFLGAGVQFFENLLALQYKKVVTPLFSNRNCLQYNLFCNQLTFFPSGHLTTPFQILTNLGVPPPPNPEWFQQNYELCMEKVNLHGPLVTHLIAAWLAWSLTHTCCSCKTVPRTLDKLGITWRVVVGHHGMHCAPPRLHISNSTLEMR